MSYSPSSPASSPASVLRRNDSCMSQVSPTAASASACSLKKSFPNVPVVYPEVVESALASLLPSTDVLDSPEFDVMTYINAKLNAPLPDGDGSPGGMENFAALHDEIQGRLRRTENDISACIRNEAMSSGRTRSELLEARDSVLSLFDQVSEIKNKAETSEQMVRTILGDIEQMDTAKHNVTASMNTVRSLKNMTIAMFKLQEAIEARQYSEATDFVLFAKNTMTTLGKYERVPKVKELSSKLVLMCRHLENRLKHDFVINARPSKANKQLPPPSPRLRELCEVATALGPDTVHRMQRQFVLEQLEDYRQAFRTGTEDAQLIRTERRYAWLRRFLRFYGDYLRHIFPDSWYVPHELSTEFCTVTREALENQLSFEADNIDVALLHRCVEKTMDFERELTARARTAWMTEGDEVDDWDNDNDPEALEEQERTADAIRRKWATRLRQQNYRGLEVEKTFDFVGAITPAFDNHMHRYIQHVEVEMLRHVEASVMDEEQWQQPEDASDPEGLIGHHLTCAADVFTFIKESMKHVSVISRGVTLLQMAVVWKRGLHHLSAGLHDRIPKDVKNTEGLRHICFIMNTSEFCSGTIPLLADEVVSRLDEEYRSQLTFDDVIEAFTLVTTNGMANFISSLERRMQPAFNEFQQTNWAQYVAASDLVDESRYIGLIRRTLFEGIETASKILDSTLLRLICTKTAKSLLSQYLGTIYRLRRINTEATHQLRVDVGALQRMFSLLPNVGKPDRYDSKVLSTYTKTVTREVNRASAVLQILAIEVPSQVIEVYLELVHESDRSLTDFGRIIDLKGLQKPERMALVEVLRRRGLPESVERDNNMQHLPVEEKDFADVMKHDLKRGFEGMKLNKMGAKLNTFFKEEGKAFMNVAKDRQKEKPPQQ